MEKKSPCFGLLNGLSRVTNCQVVLFQEEDLGRKRENVLVNFLTNIPFFLLFSRELLPDDDNYRVFQNLLPQQISTLRFQSLAWCTCTHESCIELSMFYSNHPVTQGRQTLVVESLCGASKTLREREITTFACTPKQLTQRK